MHWLLIKCKQVTHNILAVKLYKMANKIAYEFDIRVGIKV